MRCGQIDVDQRRLAEGGRRRWKVQEGPRLLGGRPHTLPDAAWAHVRPAAAPCARASAVPRPREAAATLPPAGRIAARPWEKRARRGPRQDRARSGGVTISVSSSSRRLRHSGCSASSAAPAIRRARSAIAAPRSSCTPAASSAASIRSAASCARQGGGDQRRSKAAQRGHGWERAAGRGGKQRAGVSGQGPGRLCEPRRAPRLALSLLRALDLRQQPLALAQLQRVEGVTSGLDPTRGGSSGEVDRDRRRGRSRS